MSDIDSKVRVPRKTVFLFILLAVLLVSSLLVFYIMLNSADQTIDGMIHVRNEKELTNAVNNAIKPTIITLDNDIKLIKTFTIKYNKDVILTSNHKNDNFYKLIGAKEQHTIAIEEGGLLQLDGIWVTHANNAGWGCGVIIFGGHLLMTDGIISGNDGGGVYVNYGSFNMTGGEISHNISDFYGGGGVYNRVNFTMTGGVITNNSGNEGGGVNNIGTFTLYDGNIFDNTARVDGGGVFNVGTFNMTGGNIFDNTAGVGGGVSMSGGFFTLTDGEISNNTAIESGGGVYVGYGIFTMSSGEISNNVAGTDGGGISIFGSFNLSGGKIISNQAGRNGGGILYYFEGKFSLSGGEISCNTAVSNGNDVYTNYDKGHVVLSQE